MAGRRPLTRQEERRLLRVVRKLRPRDRALVTCQWWTGFRISEILALTVGQVWRDGAFLSTIGIAPRHLKGGRGRTRWIPILPELGRALEHHIHWLERNYDLIPDLPLFPSRQRDRNDRVRALHRCQADEIINGAFHAAGIADDGRLGTHSLRKTFARRVYENADHDIMILKQALGHSDVSITQKYLEVEEDVVMAVIRDTDFTRRTVAERRAVERQFLSATVSA